MQKTNAQLLKEVAQLKKELEQEKKFHRMTLEESSKAQSDCSKLQEQNERDAEQLEEVKEEVTKLRKYLEQPTESLIKHMLSKKQLPDRVRIIKQVAVYFATEAQEQLRKHETTAKFYANNLRDLKSALTEIVEGNTVYNQFND